LQKELTGLVFEMTPMSKEVFVEQASCLLGNGGQDETVSDLPEGPKA